MKYTLKTTVDAFGLGASLMGIISKYNHSICVYTFIMFVIFFFMEGGY